jgi:ABC-type multidrug transport system ATPase subunit
VIQTPPALLAAKGLCLQLPGGHAAPALSFEITAGVTLVQGGEGTGKTSLLRTLAGEMSPSRGAMDRYQSSLFWADPKSAAFDDLTPRQYFEQLVQHHRAFDIAYALELASTLSIDAHLDKPMYMLSTGSKRKVWLIAGFAAHATIALFDMPFAALDARSANQVCQLLKEGSKLTNRAWVLADYTPPPGVPLAQVIDLGD